MAAVLGISKTKLVVINESALVGRKSSGTLLGWLMRRYLDAASNSPEARILMHSRGSIPACDQFGGSMNTRRTLSAVAIGACGPVALSVMSATPAHAEAYTSNDCKIVADPPTYNSATNFIEGRGLVICTQNRALTISAQLKKDFGASGWQNVGSPGNSSTTTSAAYSNYARQACDFSGVANIKTVVTVTADGSAPATDYGPTRSFSC